MLRIFCGNVVVKFGLSKPSRCSIPRTDYLSSPKMKTNAKMLSLPFVTTLSPLSILSHHPVFSRTLWQCLQLSHCKFCVNLPSNFVNNGRKEAMNGVFPEPSFFNNPLQSLQKMHQIHRWGGAPIFAHFQSHLSPGVTACLKELCSFERTADTWQTFHHRVQVC